MIDVAAGGRSGAPPRWRGRGKPRTCQQTRDRGRHQMLPDGCVLLEGNRAKLLLTHVLAEVPAGRVCQDAQHDGARRASALA